MTHNETTVNIKALTKLDTHLIEVIAATKHPILFQLRQAVKHSLVIDGIAYRNQQLNFNEINT